MRDGIRAAARATGGRVLTVEDHYAEGGLGDAVLDALAAEPASVVKLAVRDIPRSGKPDELLRLFGLDAASIAATRASDRRLTDRGGLAQKDRLL